MISAKKLILSIETTLRTLPFTKISLKSSGPSISEKIRQISTTYTHKYLFFFTQEFFLACNKYEKLKFSFLHYYIRNI